MKGTNFTEAASLKMLWDSFFCKKTHTHTHTQTLFIRNLSLGLYLIQIILNNRTKEKNKYSGHGNTSRCRDYHMTNMTFSK